MEVNDIGIIVEYVKFSEKINNLTPTLIKELKPHFLAEDPDVEEIKFEVILTTSYNSEIFDMPGMDGCHGQVNEIGYTYRLSTTILSQDKAIHSGHFSSLVWKYLRQMIDETEFPNFDGCKNY